MSSSFPVVERDGLLERYITFNLSNGRASLVLVDAIMRIIQHNKDSGFFLLDKVHACEPACTLHADNCVVH